MSEDKFIPISDPKEAVKALNQITEMYNERGLVIKSLQQRIKDLKEKLSLYEWKDAEEIPRDGSEVLATDGDDVFTVKYVKSRNCNRTAFLARTSNEELWNIGPDHHHENEYMYVTKWMPKPTPPTQEGEE